MGSMKGPSSDISASSRVVPESETVTREPSRTSPNEESIAEQETSLLSKLASPIVNQDNMATDQNLVVGPVVPDISTADENVENKNHPRQTNDPSIQTIRAIELTETDKHKSWKVIGKLAVLAQSMNVHTIDIYHDRKLNTSRFMIHPNSKLRRTWEVTTVCLVLYVCVMVSIC
ncbi:hypothetical protein DVH05_022742 [Phytophthora capsici]|nr:hypothetical protein DVH05_022742 [Phytophthora capsici]